MAQGFVSSGKYVNGVYVPTTGTAMDNPLLQRTGQLGSIAPAPTTTRTATAPSGYFNPAMGQVTPFGQQTTPLTNVAHGWLPDTYQNSAGQWVYAPQTDVGQNAWQMGNYYAGLASDPTQAGQLNRVYASNFAQQQPAAPPGSNPPGTTDLTGRRGMRSQIVNNTLSNPTTANASTNNAFTSRAGQAGQVRGATQQTPAGAVPPPAQPQTDWDIGAQRNQQNRRVTVPTTTKQNYPSPGADQWWDNFVKQNPNLTPEQLQASWTKWNEPYGGGGDTVRQSQTTQTPTTTNIGSVIREEYGGGVREKIYDPIGSASPGPDWKYMSPNDIDGGGYWYRMVQPNAGATPTPTIARDTVFNRQQQQQAAGAADIANRNALSGTVIPTTAPVTPQPTTPTTPTTPGQYTPSMAGGQNFYQMGGAGWNPYDPSTWTQDPWYQWQQQQLNQQMADYLGSIGRSNSTYGMNAMADAMRGLNAAQSRDLYNRWYNEDIQQYNRERDLLGLGYNAAANQAGAYQDQGNLFGQYYNQYGLNDANSIMNYVTQANQLGGAYATQANSLAQNYASQLMYMLMTQGQLNAQQAQLLAGLAPYSQLGGQNNAMLYSYLASQFPALLKVAFPGTQTGNYGNGGIDANGSYTTLQFPYGY